MGTLAQDKVKVGNHHLVKLGPGKPGDFYFKKARPRVPQDTGCQEPDNGGFYAKYGFPLPTYVYHPKTFTVGNNELQSEIPIADLSYSLVSYKLVTMPFIPDLQTFGHNGEYTSELLAQHQLAMAFWKLSEEGFKKVPLAGWHSEPLSDPVEMRIAVEYYLNTNSAEVIDMLTDSDFEEIVHGIMLQIESKSVPDDYKNPLLTPNAFATTTCNYINGRWTYAISFESWLWRSH